MEELIKEIPNVLNILLFTIFFIFLIWLSDSIRFIARSIGKYLIKKFKKWQE